MKKSVVLSLAIIMCLFAVTGSIAYFTDSITVQNEVQSGTLHIEQFEFERVTPPQLIATSSRLPLKKENPTLAL